MAKQKRKSTVIPKDHVNKAGHSMNPDRGKQPLGSTMRSKTTIRRLQMQRNFKPKRDKLGNIVRAAPFQNNLPSGSQARVEPNRRWFGNTRVISQDALQHFQDAMSRVKRDPRQVVLRATKAPITLLTETAKRTRPVHILDMESFEWTFGKKAQRKRARWEHENLDSFVQSASVAEQSFNLREEQKLELKPIGAELDLVRDPHFLAGQSRRVWNELYKVVDSSDVLFHVLDARDPQGTRCRRIEKYLAEEKTHKHLVWILNKVDLVPKWVAKAWLMELQKEHPTVAFRAHLTKPFGKKTLLSLMRQYPSLFKDRKQISIGVIGFPNVGKSSVINTMQSRKVCNVAPIAGETKVWQYVRVTSRIYFIDCPGVVYPEGESEADLVLKGVVRVEYLRTPELYVTDVLNKVRADFLCRFYGIERPATPAPPASTAVVQDESAELDKKKQSLGSAVWPDPETFLEALAHRRGKLLRKGEPDLSCVAKIVLNDFQRGHLPYFSRPPSSAIRIRSEKPEVLFSAPTPSEEKSVENNEDICEEVQSAAVDVVCAETVTPLLLSQEKENDDDFIPMLPSSDDETELKETKPLQSASKKSRGTKRKSAVAAVDLDEDDGTACDPKSKKKEGSSRQRRREEREALRPKKIGQHFYTFANVKNRSLAHRLEKQQRQEEKQAFLSAKRSSKRTK